MIHSNCMKLWNVPLYLPVQSAKKFSLKNMMKDFALISSTGIFCLALIGFICPVS